MEESRQSSAEQDPAPIKHADAERVTGKEANEEEPRDAPPEDSPDEAA